MVGRKKPGFPLNPSTRYKLTDEDEQNAAVLGGISKFAFYGLVIYLCLSSIVMVSVGTRVVHLRFGEIQNVWREGLHFRAPFIDRVITYSVLVHTIKRDCDTASSDLQSVITTVALSYKPDPSSIGKIHSTLGPSYEAVVISPSIEEAVKATTAQYTAEDLIVRREIVKMELIENIKERIERFGIRIELVNIENFKFSDAFDQAIEAKQLAEQKILTMRNELEQVKVDAQKRVVDANATAISVRLEADATAYAVKETANATAVKRLLVATAEAEALRLQREQLTKDLIELRQIEKWDGQLPVYMFGNNEGMNLLLDIGGD